MCYALFMWLFLLVSQCMCLLLLCFCVFCRCRLGALVSVAFLMYASTPTHAFFSTGGETAVLPRIKHGYPKTTNPQFNILLWLQEVPVGSTLITAIHEKIEAEPNAPAVTFCHGTAKINPWDWSLDVKKSLGHAGGCWIDLPPQTKVENDRGPVLNVTCKILAPQCRTPDPLEYVEESGGQGVLPEQALHMPSAPADPGAVEVEVTSEDSFKMCVGQGVTSSGSQGVSSSGGQDVNSKTVPVAESTTCCFYIPRAMMERPANLWPDDMIDVKPTPGLPLSPLINYNVMAIGWDWTTMSYHKSSIAAGMDESVTPKDCLASVVRYTAQYMTTCWETEAQALVAHLVCMHKHLQGGWCTSDICSKGLGYILRNIIKHIELVLQRHACPSQEVETHWGHACAIYLQNVIYTTHKQA